MSREQELSDLIGYIYDCAVDPSLWKATLPHIVAFMDSRTANIDIVNRIPGPTPLVSLFEHGFPPGAMEDHWNKFGHTNILVPVSMMYDAGEVFSPTEALGEGAFHDSAEYKDWCVPHGFLHMICAIIRKDRSRQRRRQRDPLRPALRGGGSREAQTYCAAYSP